MPLSSAVVGQRSTSHEHRVDARWIMAYAAALGDDLPEYFDTSRAAPVIAHPLFPVCLEWPVVLECRELEGMEQLSSDEYRRTVHASHDLHIERPIKAGDRLTTDAVVIAVQPKKPGALKTIRFDTRDAEGRIVARSYHGGIYRGVEIDGEPRTIEDAPPVPAFPNNPSFDCYDVAVAGNAAHVYTECARIWNPIHTDRAVALAAGLPDIILHGTATLALAVSTVIRECLGRDPTGIRRIAGRFSGMVLMPTTLNLRVAARMTNGIAFEMLDRDGGRVISDGFVEVA